MTSLIVVESYGVGGTVVRFDSEEAARAWGLKYLLAFKDRGHSVYVIHGAAERLELPGEEPLSPALKVVG